MRLLRLPIAQIAFVCTATAIPGLAADATPKRDAHARPLILVHYMPWFEAKPVSGDWGWHWTMGRFNPDHIDATGQREIASHDYPLIGPYDSADPDVLEYHTLLMKVAGIDGAIADWYGTDGVNDYGAIHRRTELLFDTLGKRGLRFAVCYEDRALKAIAEQKKLTSEQVVEHARAHVRFCAEHWFNDPLYLTWNGKPLLLVFGPDYLQADQWRALFSSLKQSPAYFSLHERKEPASGTFAWPPMWLSKNGTVDPTDLNTYLDRFYAAPDPKIGAAFPRFHDIYEQAGVHPSYGRIDARDGATFRETLERALSSGAPFVQIATWNDFGEGTTIEPTRDHGYRDLETIQNIRRRDPGEHLPFRAADLRLPLRIYQLRRKAGIRPEQRKAIDDAARFLGDGDPGQAEQALRTLEQSVDRPN
jgi:hypothetical protein